LLAKVVFTILTIQIMEVNYEIGLIPVLQKFDPESWVDFKEKWAATYRSRGGDRKMRTLIVSHVAEMLRIQLDIADPDPLPEDDNELLGRINLLFAPRNTVDAVRRLEEVKQVKNTYEGVSEFCL
jgi:hypothetical protein